MTTSAGDYLYAYDNTTNHNLVTVTRPGGAVRTYHYGETAYTSGASLPNHLTGITDENGLRYAIYNYDTQGRAISTEHANGVERYAFTYNTDGTTLVTDPLNTARTYSFQTMLGVVKNTANTQPCVNCSAHYQSQSYDANGNLASRTDWNGNRTNYAYDLARNLETSRTEGLTSSGDATAQTRTITTAWHANFRLPTAMAEPLRLTTYIYNGDGGANCGLKSDGVTLVPGVLCSKTVQATTDTTGAAGLGATLTGSPRTWTYTYNPNGLVLTINGPRVDVADITTYTYYADNATCSGASTIGCRGQIETITNAAGHVTQITDYNAHGQPLSITDPNGLVTTLTYDSRMRLTSRNAGGETTTYIYDGVGQLTKVTLPDASYIEYAYDPAHRLTEIRLKDSANALIGKTVFTLDAMGNRTQESTKDPADVVLQVRSREYNALNRLIKDIGGSNPATQVTQYGYDNQGNLTSVDGPLDNAVSNDVRTYTYDALNRLATQVDPSGAVGGTTTYGYTGLDQLASVTDPRSLVTSYGYDGLNNLNQRTSPDTGATVNTFDAAGNLLTSTDAKGQATGYAYDALNRVTSITYQGGVTHTYQYDQGVNGKGRLTTVIEPNSTTQYAYDQKGRLTSETRTINAVAYITGYSYDSAGRLTGMIYPSGRTVTYTLDGLGRIQSITTTKDSTTQTVVSSVAYRPFGPFQSFTFGNGQSYTRGFDLDGRIASYTLGNQSFPITVGYDEAGRITLVSDTGNPNNTQNYGYDALDRLMNLTGPTVTSQNFSYDPVGNRVTKTVGANADTYSYSPTSNRLASIAGASNRTYTHDPNGSITGDGLNTFGYDARGRLTQAISGIGTTDYQVNSLGQRIRKMNAQGDTLYHYDAQGHLIAESGPAGQILKEYLYLGDTPVAVLQ